MLNKTEKIYGVDVHCHILPGVDDGAKDFATALEMISMAQKEGIGKIICTPHFQGSGRNPSGERVVRTFLQLKEEAKRAGLKAELFLGNEVLYFQRLEEAITEGAIQTMNHSEYVLVEFYPKDSYQTIRNALYHIMTSDYRPVLAHMERYECLVSRMEYVEELKRLGVRLQINASSIMGKSGLRIKGFTREALRRQLVDYLATDAHNTGGRAPRMQGCMRFLQKKYDGGYVEDILYQNAIRDFGLEGT